MHKEIQGGGQEMLDFYPSGWGLTLAMGKPT